MIHNVSLFVLRPRIIVDFSLIIVPAVLMNTVLSHITAFCSLLMFAVAAVCYLVTMYRTNQAGFRKSMAAVCAMELETQRPFINYTRSFVNCSTAIVILGVDFVVFPRRFAKTETFGTGYMDIGVGCFVIINALVCPEAKGKVLQCK
jgi:phosphatidylinositol glycan class W